MEGECLSKIQWQDFYRGEIWRSFLFELHEREQYLVELFREGDVLWNADVIRGKLTEIEFFKQIPQSLIASIIIKEANQKEREDLKDGEFSE